MILYSAQLTYGCQVCLMLTSTVQWEEASHFQPGRVCRGSACCMYHVKHTRNMQCLLHDILWLFQAVQREKADSEADIHPCVTIVLLRCSLVEIVTCSSCYSKF